MAKKLSYRPVEPIELEFADGKTKNVIFNSESVSIIDEEFEGTIKLLLNAQKKPFEVGAKITYAGMKAYGEEITYDEVKSLIVKMPFHIIMELISKFTDNVNKGSEKTNKTTQDIALNFMKEMIQSK